MSMTEITRRLASLVVKSSFPDLPGSVRHEAKRSLFNWLGCALGGCNNEAVDVALRVAREFTGPPQATILGRGARLDVMHAALINGISCNVLDFNETHADMVIHPVEPVAGAILALAEYRRTSGAELLHALVLGVELECRLFPLIVTDERFWAPSVVSSIGAAAGAGRLLGLNEQQMVWALGIAGSQASGLGNQGGTMSKTFNPAHAARCGLFAALLAANGFTSSDVAMEGNRGFLQLYGSSLDPEQLIDEWGKAFHIEKNTYKAFPCGAVASAAIDACLQLRRRCKLTPDQIAAVSIKVHPSVLKLMDRRSPESGLHAKLSIHHVVACALVFGAVKVKHFETEILQDSRIVALRRDMQIVQDESFTRDQAYVSVTLKEGRTLAQEVRDAIGSLQRPLSDHDLETKFRDLAEDVLSTENIDRIVACLWGMESLEDAGSIAGFAQGRAR